MIQLYQLLLDSKNSKIMCYIFIINEIVQAIVIVYIVTQIQKQQDLIKELTKLLKKQNTINGVGKCDCERPIIGTDLTDGKNTDFCIICTKELKQ